MVSVFALSATWAPATPVSEPMVSLFCKSSVPNALTVTATVFAIALPPDNDNVPPLTVVVPV